MMRFGMPAGGAVMIHGRPFAYVTRFNEAGAREAHVLQEAA